MIQTYTQEDLSRVTATPAALGVHIGEKFMGEPYRPYPWILHMEQAILSMLYRPGNEILVVSVPAQSGKLETLDTRIPTPTGWTTIGEISPGDRVLGADGAPCNVTYVTETQWRPVHDVEFDDGSVAHTGPEHLWTTFDNRTREAYGGRRDRRRGAPYRDAYQDGWWDWKSPGRKADGSDRRGPETLTTSDMQASLRCAGGTKANHAIPTTLPLSLPEVDLPIDPWVLGYWLGNGARGTGTVSTGGIDGEPPDLEFVSSRTGGNPRVVSEYSGLVTVPGLIGDLKMLGVEQDKRVPSMYLRSSAEQRLALLQGLMDSDGGPERSNGKMSGATSFSSKDRHLADAVAELCVSLGAKVHRDERPARFEGRTYGTAHRVSFTPGFNPFSLPRKADRWQPAEITGRGLNRHHRQVVDVRNTGVVAPMRCIQVDAPGSLYLTGEGMVPTHNTTYCGLLLPLWYLGRHPNHQVMFISYNEKQASKWGLRVRNAMQAYGSQLFGVAVSSDSSSVVDWKMGNGFGGMMSTGIEGGISGNPGHLILADDLLKNADEANSPAINKRNLDEWDQSVMTRLQDDTKVLLIATRWTDHDVSGEVIQKSLAEDYAGITVNTLNIKAIAEPDPDEASRMTPEELEEWRDFLNRKHGEGLKGQHSQRFFEMRRGSMSPRAWSAMYQGTPTHVEGGMFPESGWAYYHEEGHQRVEGDADLPHMNQRVRVWDIASSEGAGDWTVGTLLGRDSKNRVFILDRQRFRHAPGGVEQKIKDTSAADGYEVTVLIEEERHGAGKTVFAHYKEILVGHRVERAKAEGDKESRATPYSIIQNQGRVFLPRHATWLREWVQEHAQMDGKGGRPKHDDQIDTAAYGVRFLIGGGDSTIMSFHDLEPGEDLSPEEQLEMAAIRRAVGF